MIRRWLLITASRHTLKSVHNNRIVLKELNVACEISMLILYDSLILARVEVCYHLTGTKDRIKMILSPIPGS